MCICNITVNGVKYTLMIDADGKVSQLFIPKHVVTCFKKYDN